MKKVIVLNGPAGSGKDTIAGIMQETAGFDTHSFKAPMFNIAEVMLGGDKFEEFMSLYNNRDTKEIPCDLLGGMSPREFFIHISESFVKPIMGKQHFGYLASQGVYDSINHVVFSDGGFPDEVKALVFSEHSMYDVWVVRLHREGFTFEGDSRNYINMFEELKDTGNYHEMDIHLTDGNAYDDAHDILDRVFE